VVEVLSDRNENTTKISATIEELCLCEELGSIMESADLDINMKVALVLAR
jgi:hypothetical protein